MTHPLISCLGIKCMADTEQSCGRCLLEVRDDAIWWNCICPNKAGKWLLSRVDLSKYYPRGAGRLRMVPLADTRSPSCRPAPP